MFEAKLREALELATQKSAAGRLKALEALCGAFLRRYCPDFIENQQVTRPALKMKYLNRAADILRLVIGCFKVS